MIEQDKSGFLVAPNNPAEFAKAIEKSFADLEQMGQYAYQKAKQDYSWEGIIEKTVRVYQMLVDKKKIEFTTN